jgi:uncharacterized protein YndB with AHSA1/START domain
MSRNEVYVDSPPSEVFAVLMDANAYPRWVVGSKRIRRVDPDWPRPGARFHHTMAAGPADLDDSSRLISVDEARRVELEVRYRPVGVAHVVIELEAVDGGAGTRVVLLEEATAGPSAKLPTALVDVLFGVRNKLSLRRLARLVERRRRSTP